MTLVNCTASTQTHRFLVPAALLISLFASSSSADPIILPSVAFASAVDDGPQDGSYDAFIPSDFFGSVNNNGFTSFRTAFEFDLRTMTSGSTVKSAMLQFIVENTEGSRSVRVHGYPGDGSMQLSDFTVGGPIATFEIGVDSNFLVVADATNVVSSVLTSGTGFAGFNVREDPANRSNFLVMFTSAPTSPGLGVRLVIDSAPPAPIPEPGTLLLLSSGLLAAGARRWRS